MHQRRTRLVLFHPGIAALLIVLAIVAGCVTRVPSLPTTNLSESEQSVSGTQGTSPGANPGFFVPGEELIPPDEEVVERVLNSLTLTEKIGQRFVISIPGTRMQHGAGRAIVRVNPAGFIVYPWNFRSTDTASFLIDTIAELARDVTPGISPFIAVDQEGGRVAAFRGPDVIQLPAAATLGRIGDPSLVRAAAYANAVQLRHIGVNLNFAPVLDVYPVADSTIIGDRSFGGDPQLVTSMVGPYLDAAEAAGVIATAKHFPGHGSTTTDSHLALPVVSMTRGELDASHLVPFVRAIERGVPAIMTAHIVFEEIDPDYPVTLSEVFLRDILRDELGFDGVVISDGLEMAAIRDHYSLETSLIRLLQNDVDLILLYRDYDIVEIEAMVRELLARGVVTEDDIERGVRRVLRLKHRYGLLHPERP